MDSKNLETILEKYKEAGKSTKFHYAIIVDNTNRGSAYLYKKRELARRLASLFYYDSDNTTCSFYQFHNSYQNIFNNNDLHSIFYYIDTSFVANGNYDGGYFNTCLQHYYNQAAASPGICFVITYGNFAGGASYIQTLRDQGKEVFCFLMQYSYNQNDINNLTNLFGADRLQVFKSYEETYHYVSKASLTLFSPQLKILILVPKNITPNSALLEIQFPNKNNHSFSFAEVEYHKQGQPWQKLPNKVTTNEILLSNLEKSTKYTVRARITENGSTFGDWSTEIIFETGKITENIQTFQDEHLLLSKIEALRKSILSYKLPKLLSEAGIKSLNLCLFGEQGNGKSSFINTALSAPLKPKEAPGEYAKAGKSHKSFTSGLTKYRLNPADTLVLWDVWGYQPSKQYAELSALIKGHLNEGFTEGAPLNEENSKYKVIDDFNTKPHGMIMIIDSISASNKDKASLFKTFCDEIKKDFNLPTLVALTKLDIVEDEEGNNIMANKPENILIHHQLISKVEDFAAKANLTVSNIYPILNYQGSNQNRNNIIDDLNLSLLSKAIKEIENYFLSMYFIRIFDQYNHKQKTLIAKTLDTNLEDFKKDQASKLITDSFDPHNFYEGESLKNKIASNAMKNFSLSKICFDKVGRTCSIRWENLLASEASSRASSNQTPIRLSAQSDRAREEEKNQIADNNLTANYFKKREDWDCMKESDSLRNEKLSLDSDARLSRLSTPQPEARPKTVKVHIYADENEEICSMRIDRDFFVPLAELRKVIVGKADDVEKLKNRKFWFVDRSGDRILKNEENEQLVEEAISSSNEGTIINITFDGS